MQVFVFELRTKRRLDTQEASQILVAEESPTWPQTSKP